MKIIKAFCFLMLVSVSLFHSKINATTVIDTFTVEDKAVLENYRQNDTDKSIDEILIKGYIFGKLEKKGNHLEMLNGLKLIYNLTDSHRRNFDTAIISYLTEEIKHGLPYLDYRIEGGTFVQGMHTLGKMRTELAINYLLSLMEPVENWPEEIKQSVLQNDDQSRWIHEIRVKTIGSLLEPDDQVSQELIWVVEERLNSYQDNETKARMIRLFLLASERLGKASVENFDMFR